MNCLSARDTLWNLDLKLDAFGRLHNNSHPTCDPLRNLNVHELRLGGLHNCCGNDLALISPDDNALDLDRGHDREMEREEADYE